MDLIIPIAGKSTRFPDMKPKWMLTHPSGKIMLIESIKGLPLEKFEKIHVVLLKSHQELFNCIEGIEKSFDEIGFKEKLNLILLEEDTKSQPETVNEAIKRAKISGSFYIKDCDNYFELKHLPSDCNCITVFSLNDLTDVNPSNKSYVEFNENGILTNIVEKQIISSNFCCGGYCFESGEVFTKFFNYFENDSSLYLSHIILKMIFDKIPFSVLYSKNYIDWGTIKDWNKFKDSFASVFSDIDGVLIENAGKYFPPLWGETKPILSNIEYLNSLYDSGKVKVILTTSRPYSESEFTFKQLKDFNIKYDQIIFDLPHAKRIIINDYSNSNPYPSCISVNIKRNTDVIEDKINHLINKT